MRKLLLIFLMLFGLSIPIHATVTDNYEIQDTLIVIIGSAGAETLYVTPDKIWSSTGSITIEDLSPDWVVSDTTELYDALDNMAAGDLIYMKRGSYRTNRWLEINTDGITIIGEGNITMDSTGVWIKPINDANVGGFQIGNTTTTSSVSIRGVGFHGNAVNQDSASLDAFWVDSASYVVIEDCYITNTSPQDEHHTGGSGITVRNIARDIDIINNTFDDIGDRAIQVAGKHINIIGNKIDDTYDRSISLDVKQDDTDFYYPAFVRIERNTMSNASAGSLIGHGHGVPTNADDTLGYWIIDNNIGFGNMRAFIRIDLDMPDDTASVLTITNNIGYGVDATYEGIKVAKYTETTNRNLKVVISNNQLHDFNTSSIRCANRDGYIVEGNHIYRDAKNGIDLENCGSSTVSGNIIEDCAEDGIEVLASDGNDHKHIIITDNLISGSGADGIETRETSGTIDNYMISNNILWDNTGEDIDDGAAGSYTLIAENIIENVVSFYPDSAAINAMNYFNTELELTTLLDDNYEAELDNEAGLYAALSDVDDFAQPTEVPGMTSTTPKIIAAFCLYEVAAEMDGVALQFERAMTITKVIMKCTAGTNVVGRLYEVDGDGDPADKVGIETSDWTVTTTETEDSSFNNATLDAGDYLWWETTSVSGSVTMFICTVYGYET